MNDHAIVIVTLTRCTHTYDHLIGVWESHKQRNHLSRVFQAHAYRVSGIELVAQ